jgi:hypothetical protein
MTTSFRWSKLLWLVGNLIQKTGTSGPCNVSPPTLCVRSNVFGTSGWTVVTMIHSTDGVLTFRPRTKVTVVPWRSSYRRVVVIRFDRPTILVGSTINRTDPDRDDYGDERQFCSFLVARWWNKQAVRYLIRRSESSGGSRKMA